MDGPAGNLQKEFPTAGGWVRPGGGRKLHLLGQVAGPEATCMGSWSQEGSRGRAREEGNRGQGRPPVSAVADAYAVSLWWPVGGVVPPFHGFPISRMG